MQRHHKTSLRAHISSATSAFFWGIIWKSSTHLAMFSSISSFRNTGRPSKLGFPTLWKTPCWKKKKKNFEHFVPRSLFSAHYRQLVCRTERTKRNSCTRKKLNKYSEIKKRLKRFVRSLQILHIIKSWKIRTIWDHSIGVVSGTW